MPPAALPATERYISPEVAVVYWVLTVADLDAPDRDELDAVTSVDLTAEVAAMQGWEITADRVAVPDLGTRKTGRISGRINPGDAQITFYASQDTDDVRAVIKRGDRGVVFIADGGDVAGQACRLFSVEVSAVTPTVDVAGTEGARIMIDFSINDWSEDAICPAAS